MTDTTRTTTRRNRTILGALLAASLAFTGAQLVTSGVTAPPAVAAGHPTVLLSKASTRDCGNVGVKTPGVPYVQVSRSLNPKSTTTGYYTRDLPSMGYIKVGRGCKAKIESISGRYYVTGNGAWQSSGRATRGTVTITIY